MMSEFMDLAIEQAKEALAADEVPVGAVIVKGGEILAISHNRSRELKDNRAHAEMLALDEALKKTGTGNLAGCEIYVTLEPCPMCAWAIKLSRLSSVICGASDYEYGACGSIYNFMEGKTLFGIRERECSELLKAFFREKRN